MQTKRKLWWLLLAIAAALPAHAQTTQIVATNIQYFGNGPVTGQFCLTPVNAAGTPIDLVTPTGRQLAPASPKCYAITNGALASNIFVPDTTLTQPVNACFKVEIRNRAGQTVGVIPCIQPSGTTWPFDSFVSTAIPGLTAVTLPTFSLNGTPLGAQTYLDLICSGCTGTGGHVTIPTGGTGNYTAAGTGGTARTIVSKLADSISIKDYGAVGDGAHTAADTAALKNAVAQAASTGQKVYVPAGTYTLDNSSTPILSGAKNVIIYGDGPSSSLACNTVGTTDCIASTGATGFGLRDLAVSFTPTATTRSSGYAVDVTNCTNCTFEGLALNNGDLSGMKLASSTHTYIRNLSISNFFANGLFAINNKDLRVEGETCNNNQDACFETSWFDSQYSTYGIPCSDISAGNIVSNNDTEAILINGCDNVTVNGFTARGSGKEAVWVGQDPTTTTLHWPDRIVVGNGTIYGSGYGSNANNVATAQALYINDGTAPISASITSFSITGNVVTAVATNTFAAGQIVYISGLTAGVYLNGPQFTVLSATSSQFTFAFTHSNVSSTTDAGTAKAGVSHVTFANIIGTHISGWGLAMAELQNTDVQLSNLTFKDVGLGNSQGCMQTEGNQVNYANVTCEDVGTYILYDTNTNRLTGTGLVGNGANKVGSGINAVYLSSTAVGVVSLNGITLNDSNPSTYTSSVFDGSSTGYHSLYNIISTGAVTPLGPTSANTGTTFTYSDTGHSFVLRNGGQIVSYAPPNVYVLPTAGTTSGSQVNGAAYYFQSKCRATPTGAEQTESVGWLTLYPTLTTESWAINKTGGCGFPLVVDMTAAATIQGNAYTGTSFNNVAITVPAALATLTLLSGITFTVNKSMVLTCTACSGPYNLDSLSGGSMVYPAAGVPSSTGTAWGTSYTVGTGNNNLVQLDSSARLPAVSGANLTNLPTSDSSPRTAPEFFPQTITAGPYAEFKDDFFTTNGMTAASIGSPTGQSCGTSTTFLDNTSPGNLSAVSGTVSAAGEACVGAGGGFYLSNAATAPSWTWETRVIVPVLPGTTAASYQAGMVHTWAASPWTTGIGFYLSSANGTANDWYCRYSSTSTDTTVAAVASTWTRLSLYDDGTKVHWYIGGTEVCGTGVAVASMPTTALASAWTSVAGSTTSVTMGLDYVQFHMNVTR